MHLFNYQAAGERDLKLLQAFDHTKQLDLLSEEAEHLRQRVADASGVQEKQVIDQLKAWVRVLIVKRRFSLLLHYLQLKLVNNISTA